MKDKVEVIFSKEQHTYLKEILSRFSGLASGGLHSIAGSINKALDECSTPHERADTVAPENSVITELFNDHARDLILCLLDEIYRLEKGKSSETVEEVDVMTALTMLTDKAKEEYGEEMFENNIISGVFENAHISIVVDDETKNIKTFVTGGKPLEFSARLDVFAE